MVFLIDEVQRPPDLFPILARSERDSVEWRKQFVQALLERDFPQWGVRMSAVALLRFWTMVRIATGRFGMPRNRRARWASASRP